MIEKLPLTTLQFNHKVPEIVVTSGASTMRLHRSTKSGLIAPDPPVLVGKDGDTTLADPEQLAVKLTAAVLLEVGQVYLDHPGSETMQAVKDVHEGFTDLLAENPKEAINVVMLTGMKLLRRILTRSDEDPNEGQPTITVGGELDLLPCKMILAEIDSVEGDKVTETRKGVRLECGESHVVLADHGDGIGPVEARGDRNGMEMRNIRASFIALSRPITDYLREKKDEDGELKISESALLGGMAAWEEVKLQEPDKVLSLLPRIEAGELKMSLVIMKADSKEDLREQLRKDGLTDEEIDRMNITQIPGTEGDMTGLDPTLTDELLARDDLTVQQRERLKDKDDGKA